VLIDWNQRTVLPRIVGSIWFSSFGFAGTTAFSFHQPIALRAVILFMVLPTVSAGIAGYIWGGTILNTSKVRSVANSLLRGVGVAAGAFGIFAVLFAFAIPMLEPIWSIHQAGALLVLTLTLGGVAAGPAMLLVGMLAGISLYQFGRATERQPPPL
jgi:hypothetical protein